MAGVTKIRSNMCLVHSIGGYGDERLLVFGMPYIVCVRHEFIFLLIPIKSIHLKSTQHYLNKLIFEILLLLQENCNVYFYRKID